MPTRASWAAGRSRACEEHVTFIALCGDQAPHFTTIAHFVSTLGDDAEARTCVCPAGKSLYRTGRNLVTNGYVAEHFRGARRDCVPCAHRAQCLRTPEKTLTRQVAFFRGNAAKTPARHTDRMKQRIDTPEGRARYTQRFGTVEPVFANPCHNKGLDRFTLRGRTKVDGQWKLLCLVHNIEKLTHHGYAAWASVIRPTPPACYSNNRQRHTTNCFYQW